CGHFRSHFTNDFVRFANGQAADSVAGKVELEKLARALAAQVGKRGTLHDAELALLCVVTVSARGFLKIITRPASPGCRALNCSFRLCARRGSFDAFVQNHRDIRTQGELNLGSFFRSKQMLGAIEMRTEAYALVGDLAKLGETEDLVAAGIGEDG